MNLSSVRAVQRKAIESLYEDLCTVAVREKGEDPVTGATVFAERNTVVDQPCRLSMETVTITGEQDDAATLVQTAKLFIAPELDIPAGSKITVSRPGLGVTQTYSQSGYPAKYLSHQEIMLSIWERWA